jgi:DNA-binding response OmpR family regulator
MSYCSPCAPAYRILFVDDEEDIVSFVQMDLEKEGFKVSTASNGLDALHCVIEENPHLVVLDVMMPGLDGFEVLRRLKENEATACIPVIMLTARDTLTHIADGLEIGADLYWTKPFSMSDLTRVIRLILEHQEQGEWAVEL